MNILDNEKFKEELMSLLIYLEQTKGVKLNKPKEEFVNNIVIKVYQILDEYQDLLQGVEEEDIFQEVYENMLKIGQYDNNQIIDIFENQFMISLKITIERYIFRNKYIYISYTGLELLHRYIKAINYLTKSLGRIPYIEEIADELQEDIQNIEIIDKIYNHYKYNIFMNDSLENTIFYSTQDENEYLIKENIINLLYSSILTSMELCIVLLTYGIIPFNQKTINCNGIEIVLDGIPKSSYKLAMILGISHTRVSQILRQAFYKIRNNKDINEYSLNVMHTHTDATKKANKHSNQQDIITIRKKTPNKRIYLFEEVKNLFNYISNGDILIGIYLITKLDNDERKILHQIYGSDLNRILELQESLKHDDLTLEKFNAILIKLKKMFNNTNNEKNLGNDEIRIIEKILIEKEGKGKGIYKILEYFGTPSAIDETLKLLFNEEIKFLKKVFGETLEDNNYLYNFYKLNKINQAIFSNILIFIKNNIKSRKQHTTANITTIEKKVYTFYEMFFCNGYSLDDINNVFEKNIDKIYEYFDNSTNQNKRIEIVTFLQNELDRECSIAPSEIKRVNVNTLTLSPTYNRIVSNLKVKS